MFKNSVLNRSIKKSLKHAPTAIVWLSIMNTLSLAGISTSDISSGGVRLRPSRSSRGGLALMSPTVPDSSSSSSSPNWMPINEHSARISDLDISAENTLTSSTISGMVPSCSTLLLSLMVNVPLPGNIAALAFVVGMTISPC